jgi:hypothetical protein
MSYLLDTHALLWTLFDDTRLSAAAKEILLDDSLDIFASVTNFWEISLKFGIGKLDLRGGGAGVTVRFEIGAPESAEARRARPARCHELENRMRDLRGKIRKETQFNRQVDLNMEIRNLEREREGLKNEL